MVHAFAWLADRLAASLATIVVQRGERDAVTVNSELVQTNDTEELATYTYYQVSGRAGE